MTDYFFTIYLYLQKNRPIIRENISAIKQIPIPKKFLLGQIFDA